MINVLTESFLNRKAYPPILMDSNSGKSIQ